MDVDRLVVAVGLLPDLREEFLAGHDHPGAGGQEGEQVELAAGEVESDAVQLGLAAQRVDAQAADAQHRLRRSVTAGGAGPS